VPQFEAGTLNQWEIILKKPEDCDFIDDNFVALAPGQCIITMALKNRPAVTQNVEIVINAAEEDFIAYDGGYGPYCLPREPWRAGCTRGSGVYKEIMPYGDC
jgi:hypothetical protein